MGSMRDEACSTLFFKFVPGEKQSELVSRLVKVKESGINNVIASYEEKGLQEARFDDNYYNTLPELAKACEQLGMTFWMEDYSPFPTGNANGAFQEAGYQNLNKLYVDERHMDLRGPVENAVIRIQALQDVVYGSAMHRFSKTDPSQRERIGVVAYKMREHTEPSFVPVLEDDTEVQLDCYIENGYLKWDIPDGYWRIFVLFRTYESAGRPYYMNLLDRDSVALEIENIHKPIYESLKEYLGISWNGFFYDEPELGNAGGDGVFDFYSLPGNRTINKTDFTVLPWSTELETEFANKNGEWIKNLPYLWYDGTEKHRQTRMHYMDIVTTLIKENYNGQVYAFCQEKGIHYIGHVLEDEGSHARLGCGTGHYFRQQYYQDEAGIDVIAGQILPGRDGASSWYGVVNADGEFYHYGLAKLASSEAHINPLKQNRAVCETFAMYGQQGMTDKKFLIDHLLINGINRILFGELNTYDASQEYARLLAGYTDRMCGLLRKSVPVIKTAILYHAETEWMNGSQVQGFQVAAGELARNQISYDVIPSDVFENPKQYKAVLQEALTVNGNKYEAMIIPSASVLSPKTKEFVLRNYDEKFPVFFVDSLPESLSGDTDKKYKVTILQNLSKEIQTSIELDFRVESQHKRWIRYEHIRSEKKDIYLIHNESPRGKISCDIYLTNVRQVVQEDPMSGLCWIPKQEQQDDGTLKISLIMEKYEMTLLKTNPSEQKQKVSHYKKSCLHEAGWMLELPDGRILSADDAKFPELETYIGENFYGKLTYRTEWNQTDTIPTALSLGTVSDCCMVTLNGVNLGRRCAAPYLYDVRNIIQLGHNQLTIEVITSASNYQNDTKVFGVSMNSLTAVPYMLVEHPGLQGIVQWLELD